MFKFYFLFLISISIQVNAMTFQVIGKNNESLLFVEKMPHLPINVGQLTIDVLNEKNIKFEGDVSGITKMFELGSALEMISGTELKAYGWCFSIDGIVPDTMTDETPIKSENMTLIWYYAYAHYKNGAWIAQCANN